jgi:uncharacterized protein (TIGR02246 family)
MNHRPLETLSGGAGRRQGAKVGTTSEDEQAIREVMDRWKAGVDAHEPAEVAGCFTEDAIFQGMRPYSVGRQGVTDYYASQPMGMRAAYKVLETRRLAEGLVLGYLWVDFSYTDKATLGVHLGVLATRTADGWRLAHYQVSYLA